MQRSRARVYGKNKHTSRLMPHQRVGEWLQRQQGFTVLVLTHPLYYRLSSDRWDIIKMDLSASCCKVTISNVIATLWVYQCQTCHSTSAYDHICCWSQSTNGALFYDQLRKSSTGRSQLIVHDIYCRLRVTEKMFCRYWTTQNLIRRMIVTLNVMLCSDIFSNTRD